MNRGQTWIGVIIVLALTWIAYSNHFHNDFHFDDHHTIVRNLHIRSLKNIPTFFVDATTTSTLPTNQAYRPGLTTLNTIDYFLSGKKASPEPFMFHLSIFISFLCLGILIFLLQKHILDSTANSNLNTYLSLAAMAFYMLHTANAETINYIIARSDSFSTLMIVLSFILYIYVPRSRYLHLYFIPALLGFFVKEPSLMFIPLLMVYKILFEQQCTFREIFVSPSKLIIPFKQTMVPLLLGISVFVFSRLYTPVIWQSGGTSSWLYFLTQPIVIIHYIGNFFVPVNLVVDTDWTLVSGLSDARALSGLFFLAFYIYILFLASNTARNRGICFGMSWFLIALLPSSSFVPFAEVLNDHRTFFPYIGLVIALFSFLRNSFAYLNITSKPLLKFASISIFLIVIFLHGTGTYQRNKVWEKEETLWEEAVLKSPKNGRAWMNYAVQLMARAEFKKAEECLLQAQALNPEYTYVNINLGIVQSHTNRPVEAENNFKKAIEGNIVVPDAYIYYAEFLVRQKRFIEAKQIIDKGLKWSPNHEQMKMLLSSVEFSLKATNANSSEATLNVLSDATSNPTAENYLELSLKHYNDRNFELSIEAAKQALILRPTYDLAYNNICAAYNQLGKYSEAIRAGEKGLEINPSNELLKGNLAESKSKIK